MSKTAGAGSVGDDEPEGVSPRSEFDRPIPKRPMLALAPVLAVDVGGLIAIAFMVISFIGWLSNLINGQQKPGQRPPQPQRPRPPQNKKLRDEIESFMQEAQGKSKPKPRPENRPGEVLSADDIEVTSTSPRRAPKPNKPGKPSKPRTLSQQPQPQARRSPGQDVAQRRVESTSLGQNVQQHVTQHMAERVVAIASRDVEPTVDDSVAAHFAPFAAEQAPGSLTETDGVRRDASPATDLLKLLRNPQGVRQALVLGEILKPPVAMRRRGVTAE